MLPYFSAEPYIIDCVALLYLFCHFSRSQ